MKIILAAAMFLATTAEVFAANAIQEKLVSDYIKASRAEQIIATEIDTYIQQYAANASPGQKAQIERYFNDAMGWHVIKNQYAELLARTYTTEELKASLAFMKSPIGDSIVKKNIEFTHQMAAMISKNMMKASAQKAEALRSEDEPMSASPDASLVALNVEEHMANGNTYFTGMIENRGTKIRRGIQIEINLFMAEKFVDQYSTYLSGSVPPGGQRYFKITCGCKDSPPAGHNSYKVQVVEGY